MAQAIVSPLVNYFLANNLAKPYADIEGEQSKSVFLPLTLIGNNNPQVQKSLYFQLKEDYQDRFPALALLNSNRNFPR